MHSISNGFEEMYRLHYKMLRVAVERIIADKDASHDIVQEVFLKLWKRRDELDLIGNKKAYLFRAVINDSIKYLEVNKSKVSLYELNIKSTDTSDSRLLSGELEKKIRLALNRLPPKCKAIFVLCRFENMKYKEIAQYLDVSLKTVENQMGIALKKMREELSPYLTKEFMGLAFITGVTCLFIF
jgi:RNA polymerase sigma-70 factor (ECF subfamily)